MQALATRYEPELVLVEQAQTPADAWLLPFSRIWLTTLLLAAPLAFGAVQPWAWGLLAVNSIILLFVWVTHNVKRGKLTVRWSPLYTPAILFLLLGVLQFSAGLTRDHVGTREALIKLTTDLILMFVAGQLFESGSRRFWRIFGLITASYASLLAAFAMIQFFSDPETIYWSIHPRWGGYIFGPFVNHNHYAGLMEMTVPIAATFLLVQTKRQPWRWLIGFGIALSLASVVVCGSRAGLFSLIVEGLILGVVFLKSRSLDGRNASAVASFAVVSAIAIFVWTLPPEVVVRFKMLARPEQLNATDRKQMSLDAFNMFREHLLLGTGLGGFETAYTPYQSVATDLIIDHAHNDIAELLAETGVIGGLLALWALAVFGYRVIGSARQLRNEIAGIRLGAAVGCCGLLVHSLFDFNLHIPANAAWFAVAAAISQARPGARE